MPKKQKTLEPHQWAAGMIQLATGENMGLTNVRSAIRMPPISGMTLLKPLNLPKRTTQKSPKRTPAKAGTKK